MSVAERVDASWAVAPALRGEIAPATIAALLDAAEPLRDAQVLVIGHHALEIICGLIRRGCSQALEIPLAGPSAAERVELAIVPDIESIEAARTAITLARRSLLPCGRIVLFDASGRLEAGVARMLRDGGFSAVRARQLAGGTLLRADWPMFGLGQERHHG